MSRAHTDPRGGGLVAEMLDTKIPPLPWVTDRHGLSSHTGIPVLEGVGSRGIASAKAARIAINALLPLIDHLSALIISAEIAIERNPEMESHSLIALSNRCREGREFIAAIEREVTQL